MNEILWSGLEILLAGGVVFFTMWIFGFTLNKITKSNVEPPPRRKLDSKEAEWLADYFHNKSNAPDADGYVGPYYLPNEAMIIYLNKYGKERYGVTDEELKEMIEELEV